MSNTENHYAKRIVIALIAWFVTVSSAAALQTFQSRPDQVPIALISAIAIPLLTFVISFGLSDNFRKFQFGLDPSRLTIAHTWRLGGYVFIALAAYGILPKLFAYPAGFGDIAIGLTAPFVATLLAKPAHQKLFVAWHILGILDLVVAIGSGLATRFYGEGTAMAPMTVLPLSLIPTFFVPVLLMLHIVSIGQASAWSEKSKEGTAWQGGLISQQN